jgi:PRTRC genetic system protein A
VSRPFVDHLVARLGVPARSGLAYDYVLSGDGVYVAAENEHLDVRVPVARCLVRGLPAVHGRCALAHGRLPVTIWNDLVRTARTWAMAGHETLLAVVHEPPWGYRVLRPPQVVGRERVIYRPTSATVLELHSHHAYPAYFSRVDDADEQGLRVYGVVGRLEGPRPEVALRVGAYGYHLPLPWEAVFEGDRGPFRDVHFDPPDAADHGDGTGDGAADGVSD